MLVAAMLVASCLTFAAEPVAWKAGSTVSLRNTQAGLIYELFGSSNLERLQESGSMPDIGPIDKGHNDWSLRFAGLLTPPADGVYTFHAEADTGVRLRIADKLVIDGWKLDGARTGKVLLTKDKPVSLVIEYFFDHRQDGKQAILRLFWTPPGGHEKPVSSSVLTHTSTQSPPPSALQIYGSEPHLVNLQLPDGGLKPVVGVHNIQVFRACRAKPELADGDGWTYAHHQDLAVWKGRLYAAWAMTPKDEDVPPYKVVYATSVDGDHWTAPADLFPREVAWATRFYFYRAANGRMLAFCAGKSAGGTVSDAAKHTLLVREITADHHLGMVYTLISPVPGMPPDYHTAPDPGFVTACRDSAGNNLLLEQQDYGVFLGERRMPWHANPPTVNGWKFGKAFCFYHRKDGMLVGLCKMGFMTLSNDAGKTWSEPVIPPTLVAGSGKVWGQHTADGRYALVYNPDRDKRFPLVLVYGDDGSEFRNMRVLHGELPQQRYPGKYKDFGPQYMRGLAEWADDGTFADKQAMWLIYSVNKEDIWVARVPLPVKPDETAYPSDDFAKMTPGANVPGWNTYSPKWAPVEVMERDGKRDLELRDGDPVDYARAVRVFPDTANLRVELRLQPTQTDSRLDIDLCDAGGRRPVRLSLTETGRLQAADGAQLRDLGHYAAAKELSLVITTDLASNAYTVQVNDGPAQRLTVAEPGCKTVQRLSLRTGPWRALGGIVPVNPAKDDPLPRPAVFHFNNISIQPFIGKQ